MGQVSQFGPTLHNFRSSDPTIPLAQPLTDYTPAHGPLLVALGAHKRTRVTQSADGRTWPVEVAAIPSGAPQPDATAVELFDPQLRCAAGCRAQDRASPIAIGLSDSIAG